MTNMAPVRLYKLVDAHCMLGACALLLPSVDRGNHLVVEPWLRFFEGRYNHLGGAESIELMLSSESGGETDGMDL
jgi:hypothetical protein